MPRKASVSRVLHRLGLMLFFYGASATGQVLLPPIDHTEVSAAPSLPDTQTLTLGNGPAKSYPLPVYANFKLNYDVKNIRRAIIVLPSTRHQAGQHFLDVSALAQNNGDRRDETLIISPLFPSPIERGFSRMPAWRKSNWKMGENSIQAEGRPAPVSAYHVIDDLVRLLINHKGMPELTEIVVAAHGEGAHLLQRYALLNRLDDTRHRNDISLRYIIANAPSYLYLTDERPRRTGVGFGSYERGICPSYNHFPYGPEHPTGYGAHLSPKDAYLRYASRDVVYLLGDADSNPEDPTLDKQCGAEAQGATRLSRGLGYVTHLERLAQRSANTVTLAHSPYRVTGVAHNAAEIFASHCGYQALFGHDDRLASKAVAPCVRIKTDQ